MKAATQASTKRDMMVAALEQAGWERFITHPQAANRTVYRIRTNRPGYVYEYKTISSNGRTLVGCYAPTGT